MISVIIPTLNEEKRIEKIIYYLKTQKLVSEIIVIDDGSTDRTFEIAQNCGALVYLSTLLGKGASMQDGLNKAKYDIVLFIDGDIFNFNESLVNQMVSPILNNEVDFVKGSFHREAGRVTEICAKPMLRIFFPDLCTFEQPLSGIIAARKQLLLNLKFENDYGVDVGILIDLYNLKAKMCEVDIGNLEHDHQDLTALSKMSSQIMKAILKRANKSSVLHIDTVRDSFEQERISSLGPEEIFSKVSGSEKIVLFDMDGTLVEGSFVDQLTRSINRRQLLDGVLGNYSMDAVERTEKIAETLSGIKKSIFEQVAKNMLLKPGAAETIIYLRKKGYRVGIISDSYFMATEVIRKRVFADFSVANLLHFKKGVASGQVTISPLMQINRGCKKHTFCKSNFIEYVKRNSEDDPHFISIGNGRNDICLFKSSQKSYAIFPEDEQVVQAASKKITELSDLVYLL